MNFYGYLISHPLASKRLGENRYSGCLFVSLGIAKGETLARGASAIGQWIVFLAVFLLLLFNGKSVKNKTFGLPYPS